MWLFILSGLIASAGKPVSASCPLELSPPEIVVKYGDPFSVNCSTASKQHGGMGWESSDGGIPLTEHVSFLTLKVDSVKNWNIAPQCYMNLDNDEQCAQRLPVTIYKKPDSVSLSYLSQMGPLVEGKHYHMQCDVANVAPARNVTVYWRKGNQKLHIEKFSESTESPVNKSSVFDLMASGDDNGTQIWCEASLDLLQTEPMVMRSKSHEVIVLYPPTFNDPANETLEAGDDSEMILKCSATGNPVPVYSWDFPQPVQQKYKNHKNNQVVLTRTFQFPGTYTCTASNAQGTKSKYFTLIEAPRTRTTFAAILGGFLFLGVVSAVALLFFVTPSGTFSLNKGSYLRGQPNSSGPV